MKIIFIPNFISLYYLYIIENINFLVFVSIKVKKYFKIPKTIFILKKNKNLIFRNISKNFFKLNNFIQSFLIFLKSLKRPFFKKLVLKGLGFKIFFKKETQILTLKLGFSHLVIIKVPLNTLKATVTKNSLTIFGFNKVEVNNFIVKIRNYKYPDSYQGKGFRYKNEAYILKEIKKT